MTQVNSHNHKTARWYVYILRCSDDTLYTGVTTDLARRLQEHNSAVGGARYTRSRQPVRMEYAEVAGSRSAAYSREYQLKRLSRKAKEALIITSTDSRTTLPATF